MSYTRWQWAQQFLADIGNKNPSVTATAFVVGWTVAETATGRGCQYNLLNTEQPAPGSTNCNYAGVQSYPDFQTGVAANAAVLKNGRYPSLLHALQTNDDSNLLGPGLFGLGHVNPASNVTGDLSMWVHGNRNSDMTGYLNNIYSGSTRISDTFPGTATGVGASLGNTPVNQIPGGLAGGAIAQATGIDFSSLSSDIASLGDRIAFFFIGIVLIFIGFVILIHPSPETLLKGSGTAV